MVRTHHAMRILLAWFVFQVALFAAAVADAEEPVALNDSVRYARATSSGWMHRQAFVANTEETISDGTNQFCFAYGSLVIVKAEDAAGECCWGMGTNDMTMGDYASETAGYVTDANGPDGPGACFDVADGERVAEVSLYQTAWSAPGAREGLCSVGELSPTKDFVRRPCRVNGDCASGTCETGLTEDVRRKYGCLRLRCMMADVGYLTVRTGR